jgi:hypothetical protein
MSPTHAHTRPDGGRRHARRSQAQTHTPLGPNACGRDARPRQAHTHTSDGPKPHPPDGPLAHLPADSLPLPGVLFLCPHRSLTPPLRLGRLGSYSSPTTAPPRFVFFDRHRSQIATALLSYQSPRIKHNKSVLKVIETARKNSSAAAVLKARDGALRPHNAPAKLRRCSQHGCFASLNSEQQEINS